MFAVGTYVKSSCSLSNTNVIATKGVCELPFHQLPNPKGGDGDGKRYNGANRGKGNAAYQRPPDRKEWSLTQAETL